MNAKKKEEQPYEFRARPVPKAILNGPTGLKEKPAVYVTEPKTPNFALKSREEKWKSGNKLLKLSCQTCSSFKAKPATVLQKPPFVPKKPLKLPLETIDVHLHTEVRAAVQQTKKNEMDINEQEKHRLLQEMKQLQEEEERREIFKLRKQLVFKANPVRHFKPFEIKPTDKALTEPVSPKFRSDERLSRFLEIRIHF